jgi:Spy/CpxP family protein refolding chaperone
MKMLFFTVASFLAIVPLPAQIVPMPPVQNLQTVYAQLTAYLNLTDTQVQNLLSIQASRNNAQQAIYKQIADKQTQLNTLLSQGTADALTVGQLEIDINNLRKQLPLPNSSYRTQALAVLTPDQVAKLPPLVNALQLQATAWQASTLDLIDAPALNGLPPLPAMMPPVGVGLTCAAQ